MDLSVAGEWSSASRSAARGSLLHDSCFRPRPCAGTV